MKGQKARLLSPSRWLDKRRLLGAFIGKFFNRLFWLTTLIFSSFSWASTPLEELQPYVTCRLMGQLGNQLYQVASTLAYAWDYQVRPLFPELNRCDYLQAYNHSRIFFRLDASALPRPYSQIYHEPTLFGAEKFPYHPDHYLVGFFQCWKHFHHHRDKLLQVFAPAQSDIEYLHAKYGWLLAHPNTVGVHVRTYNAGLHYAKIFPFLGMEYYEKAMNFFPADALFVVFSDRINWCKQHFSQLAHKNVIFIEGNDYIQDLFLMSLLKHHIIANSTFSWWGAYLCQHPHQIVVAPRDWVHPEYWAVPKHENFYLPHWRIVDYDYSASYPTDIQFYETTSIDTK